MKKSDCGFCLQCDLKFHNLASLERHKRKFCVEKLSKKHLDNIFNTKLETSIDEQDVEAQSRKLEIEKKVLIKDLKRIETLQSLSSDDRNFQKNNVKLLGKSARSRNKANIPRKDIIDNNNGVVNTNASVWVEDETSDENCNGSLSNCQQVHQYHPSNIPKKHCLKRHSHMKKENSWFNTGPSSFHERRLVELKQETEIISHMLELERLRQELITLHGHPKKTVLPMIGYNHNTSSDRVDSQVQLETSQNLVGCFHEDDFVHSPFDPLGGFVVFWDFILTNNLSISTYQLQVFLLDKQAKIYSHENIQPLQLVNKIYHGKNLCILGEKQVFQKHYPNLCSFLSVSMKMGGNGEVVKGWTKFSLFDENNQVNCGRWKVIVREKPLRLDICVAELNCIPQVDGSEIYFRLLNSRDSDQHGKISLHDKLLQQYRFFAMSTHERNFTEDAILDNEFMKRILCSLVKKDDTSKELDGSNNLISTNHRGASILHSGPFSPMSMAHASTPPTSKQSGSITSVSKQPQEIQMEGYSHLLIPAVQAHSPRGVNGSSFHTLLFSQQNLGIQVHSIVDMIDLHVSKVQFTVIGDGGKVAVSDEGNATFCVEPVEQTYFENVHLFGMIQTKFQNVGLYANSYVLIEVSGVAIDQSGNDELIVWATLPLFPDHVIKNLSKEHIWIEEGERHVVLRKPPLPDIIDNEVVHENEEEKIAGCFPVLLLFIYSDNMPPMTLPMKLPAKTFPDSVPSCYWQNVVRLPPARNFRKGMGFDVYVDAINCLPHATVAAKVVIAMYDANAHANKFAFNQLYETFLELNTSALHPKFIKSRFEFRSTSLFNFGCKLLFLVFVLDELSGLVSLYGCNSLPVFVESGTFQPAQEKSVNVSLNEGAIQMRLYEPLQFDDASHDFVAFQRPRPCTSVLIRIVNAACYSDGQAKRSFEIPEDEWIAEKILSPTPNFEEGTYDTQDFIPTKAEKAYFQSYLSAVNFDEYTVKDKLLRSFNSARKLKSEERLLDYVKGKFKAVQLFMKYDMKPLRQIKHFPKHLIFQYDAGYGFSFNMTRAQNIPWQGFTFGSCSLSPPKSLYKASFDDPALLYTDIHPNDLQKHPQWRNKNTVFPRRCAHANLCMIIHLYEVVPTSTDFTIRQEAWTFFPLLQSGYLHTGIYQLPLFIGSPSHEVLKDIQEKSLSENISVFRKKKLVKLLEASSVFVTLADAREINDSSQHFEVNRQFLPTTGKYSTESKSQTNRSLVPPGIPVTDYLANVASAFKQIIWTKVK